MKTLRWNTGSLSLIAILTAYVLVGCGGGSSYSSPSSTSTKNAAPVANAGSDQNVTVGTAVTLDGSLSSDTNGDPLIFIWSFESVPVGSAAALSSRFSAKPTFTADVAGSYVARLVVNDGSAESVVDSVIITAAIGNSAPVANSGPDQNVAKGALVTLDGSGSSDANGDALLYAWSFDSIPPGSTATLSSSTSVNPTFTADLEGSYVVRLVVNDGAVDGISDTVTITASTGNSAPVANAGPDQNVTAGTQVSLDGSGSSDADNNLLTYSWSFVSVPKVPKDSTAALSFSTTAKPSFTADLEGTYVVRLVVNDGAVDSVPDTVTVTAAKGNSVPVANAGPDQSVTVGAQIVLDGSGSSDADGNPLTYSWSFVSKPSGSTAALSSTTAVKPSFTADKSGSYVVNLVVNDGFANSVANSVTITAATGNLAPVANAGVDQSVNTGTQVNLDGSGSSDANNDPLTYLWSFVSMPSGSSAALSSSTSAKPSFVADKDGSYTVRLVVSDGVAESAPDNVAITATTPNSAPVANAGPDQNVTTGTQVTLDGSGSSDANGNPLTYSWSFVSKPTGSTAVFSSSTTVKPSFTADLSGSYVISLVVNDGTVDSVADTVTVTAAAANSAPVANAGPDQNVTTGVQVTLDGSSSSDADGNPLTYSWSFVSVPSGSTAVLSSSTDIKPSFTADVSGDYVISLTVHDGTVGSAVDSVKISATAASPPATNTPK